MGYSVDIRGVIPVGSFTDCEKVFREDRRKKKWSGDVVALSRPTKDHFTLHRVCRDGLIAYDCVLYRTALVRYWADGRVRITPHDSRSSCDFVSCVMPRGIGQLRGMRYFSIETPRGTEYHRTAGQDITLIPVSPGVWEVGSQTVPRTKKRKVRSRCAEVRKLIAPARDQAIMLRKLLGISQPMFQQWEVRRIAKLLLAGEEPDILANWRVEHPDVLEAAYAVAPGCFEKVPVPYSAPPTRAEWA
jgi:hypothetical protein